MFGRSARLPVDKIFGIEPDEGQIKMQTSYAKYVQDWTDSMNQAFQIAQKHACGSGEQNKRYYDKKVRGVEIVVGDKVLSKNREKGGTGKLKTFWEDKVYVVVDVDENTPVYTIKPERGRGKPKRVHRNDIMRCNELLPPCEVELPTPVKPKSETSKPRRGNKSKTVAVEDIPEKEGSDDSDAEELVGIVRDRDAVDVEDTGIAENDCSVESENDDEIEDQEQEDQEQEEGTFVGDDEVEDTVHSPGSDDDEDLSEEEGPTRKSTRSRTTVKRFTYDKVGGNPTYS